MKGRKDRDATFAYQNAGGLKDSIHERGRGGLSGKPGCSQGQGAGQKTASSARSSMFPETKTMACCTVAKTAKSRQTLGPHGPGRDLPDHRTASMQTNRKP